MTRRLVVNTLSLLVLALLATMIVRQGAKHMYTGEVSPFAESVNLAPMEAIAVHRDGRLNSFASHARTMMQHVSGAHSIRGQSPSFTYLDMLFRPDRYIDEPVIYVKNKVVRAQIADAIAASGVLEGNANRADVLADIISSGLVAPRMLGLPGVQTLLEQLNTDLIRTAPEVQRISNAMQASNPQALVNTLAIIPPPGDDVMKPWFSLSDLVMLEAGRTLPGVSDEKQARVMESVQSLGLAWQDEDAAAVSDAAAGLAATLRSINPALYPSPDRLEWERWYFAAKNLTWIWMIYLASVAALLMSVVYRWRGAAITGLAIFGLAFALHTFAVLLRWYVSGRWPNANMFEAVTTSVWFGGCAAIILEILVRKTAMRHVFALGAAVASMVALMCAAFLPIDLNANISNKMPVLHDVWLYIHTNVIIFSYCLIAMAAVSSLLYLRHRAIGGPADYAKVGGAGSLVMAGGGAAGMPTHQTTQPTSAGSVFDGATMVLMELSFILLWAGLVMGAIWADHSWGRPWGWDPKEVFALNTFIVFALLIHVRLKTKDKGLWTALLAVAGAGVMLFNWIIINFAIVGLHSYA
jgi:cytochrome c-type biogenesis protein CcsB